MFCLNILNTVRLGRKGKFPSKGSVKGNMPLIRQRPFGVIPGAVIFFFFFFCFFLFFFFFFSITISGDSAAYFFEIIMLISLKDTLTQTRTKLDRVPFPCNGPMRSRYVVIMVKFQFYRYRIQLVFLETKSSL